MSAHDDPTHPLWPAFESPSHVPTKAWVVLYEGLSGNWLASSTYYHRDNAIILGSKFDRGVKIIELSITNTEDFPLTDRMKFRKSAKVKKIKTESDQQQTIKVRKIKTD